MKKTAIVIAALAAAALSQAQTRSSFLGVDSISDISVQISNQNLSYLVTVGNNPTFTYQNVTYNITDVIGFWNMSDTVDVVGSNQSVGVWSANGSNSGQGGILGWKTSPNTGLTPGQQFTFTYDSLDANTVSGLGFHVRIDGTFPGTSGNTGYINVVPEPASMVGLATGLAAFVVRRRKR